MLAVAHAVSALRDRPRAVDCDSRSTAWQAGPTLLYQPKNRVVGFAAKCPCNAKATDNCVRDWHGRTQRVPKKVTSMRLAATRSASSLASFFVPSGQEQRAPGAACPRQSMQAGETGETLAVSRLIAVLQVAAAFHVHFVDRRHHLARLRRGVAVGVGHLAFTRPTLWAALPRLSFRPRRAGLSHWSRRPHSRHKHSLRFAGVSTSPFSRRTEGRKGIR